MGTSGGARAGERAVTEVEPPGRGQDGDGNYLAVCHARHPADNGLRLGTGRYEDRLRRVDGQWQWRIARRRILTDWIAPAVAAGVAESP